MASSSRVLSSDKQSVIFGVVEPFFIFLRVDGNSFGVALCGWLQEES